MKKLLLFLACSGIIAATAQTTVNTVNISSTDYNALKASHHLDLSKHYVFTDALIRSTVKATSKARTRSESPICSCLIPLDSTFSLVPFSSGIGPDYRNDDGSSDPIALPFSFNLYGINYTSLYINNNGNISFVSPYPSFSSSPFPSSSYNMIAPFWADVDTRDSAGGIVYYKVTPTSLIVKWEGVGYYPMHSDLKNTFQLIITDGTDPILPTGDNVSFCYGDMQWTTGEASDGIGGFGGVAATVGVNQGDSIGYFQVGRFDGPGTGFDGPYTLNDSVDWLDNQGMYFDVATVGNIPPVVINNNICDTIDVFTGDTLRSVADFVEFKVGVSTPEADQTVTASFSCDITPAENFTYTLIRNTPTYKEYNCKVITGGTPAGLYTVTVNATDNGTPAKMTTRTILVRNTLDVTLEGIKENSTSAILSIYPNPAEESITVKHNFNTSSNPILTIVDVIGQRVKTMQLNNQEQTIDVSGFSKGVYFATITSKEGKTKTVKIIRN